MTAMTERLEKVSIDRLVPYARNARTHSKEQIQQLRSSLREFGFVNPVLIDKDYNIIAGHGRVLAAREEGVADIPCVFVEHLTEAQKRAYVIADNRLALNAGWDDEMLSVEMSDLQGMDFDLSLLGFDGAEMAKLLDSGGDVWEDDFDLEAALEKAAFVLPGDVWTMGRHRLICGDATDADTVRWLMDGKKANLIVTDPPYNVDFESSKGLKIQNDSMKSDTFYAFLLAAFKNGYDNLADGGAFYCFHSDAEKVNFFRACVDAGFHYSTTCVWVKNALVLGRGDYNQRHEPILYAFKDTSRHKFYGDRKQTTVWNFDKPMKNNDHPTSKPLDLIAYPIRNSSQANGIVLDTFGGSGSTLLACEQTDRVCYTLEIDPKYASAIPRRYAEFKRNGGEDITCQRGGEILRYADLAKDVERGERTKEPAHA